MKKYLLTLPVILALGCGKPSGPTPAAEIASATAITSANQESLLPMSEGNTWIFDAEIQSAVGNRVVAESSGEIIFKMSDVKKVAGGTQATLTVSSSDSVLGVSTWQIGPTGLVQLSGGVRNVAFSSPEPVLKFPLEQTKLMTWANSGEMPDGNTGSQAGKTEVFLAPQIDTAVSTVSGVASKATVDFKTQSNEGREITTTWFQPGVGIVRLVQSTISGDRTNTTTIRLKSWTVQR